MFFVSACKFKKLGCLIFYFVFRYCYYYPVTITNSNANNCKTHVRKINRYKFKLKNQTYEIKTKC